MKRKYYMRGLGLGVLVTAILCAVALPTKTEPMTDAEIIARAEELGYVKDESGVTPEDINKIKENEKASGTPEATKTTEPAEDRKPTEEPEGTPGPTPSPIPTPDAPEPPEEPDKPDLPATPTPKPASYTISVERGATARRVAERLESIGAVADSEAFVKYLQSRNLTDYINIGTFTIPQGATEEEIARILTGK